MYCRENASDYLRGLGYCVVRFPKSDVSPLLMLARSGRTLDRFGRLDTVLTGSGREMLPEVHVDLPAANISGRSSSALRLGIGLSILGDFLAAMGGSPLGLGAAYRGASRITFEFQDVLEDRIEVSLLDRYISGADINPNSIYAGRLLDSDDMYVVTSILKTDKVVVRAWDDKEGSVDLDLSALQSTVGGQVNISSNHGQELAVTFAGRTPLTFGFQAYRLVYKDGEYEALAPATRVALRGDADDSDSGLLGAGSPFVRISG